jgi:tetratricopeptide (TPR) repeat protein
MYRIKCMFDRAIAAASEAIRLDPNNAVAHGIRAESYRCRSEFEFAIADATIAIRLNHPDAAFAYRTRGECFLRTKEFDRAIVDASAAIQLDPTNAFPFGTRGMAFFEKGEFARAAADLSEAHRLDPNDVLMANSLKEAKRRCEENQPLDSFQQFYRQLEVNSNVGKFSICCYDYDRPGYDYWPVVIGTANSREEAEVILSQAHLSLFCPWIEPPH